MTNFYSTKLKELADDNFEYCENGRRLSKTGRKHRGKTLNCSLRAISPFCTVFSKDFCYKNVKTRASTVWERVKIP